MEWYERMKTKIEVGKKYKNREGVAMSVVEEHPIESNYRERFWVVDETKNRYYYPEYTDGYSVNDFGGFGTYPNQRDLIELMPVKELACWIYYEDGGTFYCFDCVKKRMDEINKNREFSDDIDYEGGDTCGYYQDYADTEGSHESECCQCHKPLFTLGFD